MPMITEDEIISLVCIKPRTFAESEELQICDDLCDTGILIRCDKIPECNELMINSSYTYTTNDSAGIKRAIVNWRNH